MSNLLKFPTPSHPQRASSAGASLACGPDADPTSPDAEWRTKAIEQIRNSVVMLDLAAQHAHVMASNISDLQVRRNLICQIEIIEKLLLVARDMTRQL